MDWVSENGNVSSAVFAQKKKERRKTSCFDKILAGRGSRKIRR